MDPHAPNKLFVTKYSFLIPGDDAIFFLFISFSFGFLLFYVIINFYENYFIIIFFFIKIISIFSCSGFYRRPLGTRETDPFILFSAKTRIYINKTHIHKVKLKTLY